MLQRIVNGKVTLKFKTSVKKELQRAFGPPVTPASKQEMTVTAAPAAWDVDKFFVPITTAAALLPQHFRIKDLEKATCLQLHATPEDAAMGYAPCPYTGIRKHMGGLIRSWVEERSPHSRQHYFRAGRRTNWKPNQRPLLFLNHVLGNSNKAVAWAPYMHVRGGGWVYDPDQAAKEVMPTEAILNTAAALYKKQGMRGATRTLSKVTQKMTKVTYVVTGSAYVSSA